ncbi:pimeloyl-ACP methyl ester esterase BioH [Serratia grimesii]|jgi:pimeloyl-[acyl-carrier protein] methyl ester esterase|uniref:pimeloyl-ACP methyl ester esterase BioH n=1 Tax=Serratia grimesii TaxID=82995 RepID=UPI00076F3CEA|nr:pimeloyl-ACP methyl ester esterase BioH [Serratia grimesii]CAI1130037.1 Pimelyl-[acyl-carrier protein] methyl ester esterase [Serratia grimesii]CAI1929075.1 Pimelyl-[acyl-carrier protein] methyl ester esterase [Serratia grimesii]CAI2518976.1 Pimelyl-[acyl-carrier protein] methyl ester esterase [Serratia grimesii]CUW24887.1 Pimeloyl-[acyl-carrier protein] methyl ester esterase [Serratia grimesii]SMZ58904.1 Pimeloyl-[acyl-carrier protein] methyl ester esterase [Serratia grimesii]
MTALYWQTIGEGDRDLVLLHGWGLNAQVWSCMLERLTPHFRLHLVDLPGYGRSQGFGAMSLEQMAETVLAAAPENAWWLGWSLGGLVASQIALMQPQRVRGLITVASSPCFAAKDDWPGIRPEVLSGFQHQLGQDFQRTVERFLALQTLGTESARQDARQLKSVVLNQPMPSVEVLNGGLEMLRTTDFREPLAVLTLPLLRIYGYLDGLVPRKVAGLLDAMWPHSPSAIIAKAAHAPFISHPDEFAEIICTFVAENGIRPQNAQ